MEFKNSVNFNKDQHIWIFKPQGDMDIYSSSIFKDQAIKCFEEIKADLLIDGENLDYIDSTGLGALISILKRVKEGEYKIYLSNMKPNIMKLFHITELDKLFVIRGEDNE